MNRFNQLNAETGSLPHLMTVEEFKAAARCSHTTAYNYLKSGAIRRIKIGRRTFLDVAQVNAWLRSHMATEAA